MKGLTTQVPLVNGRLFLTEGVEKARDAILFYTIFDKFRVYSSDFGSNFVSLLQKPASYIQMNSTIILGVYGRGVEKYVPDVKVNSIDVGYFPPDRKSHRLKITYSVKEEDNSVNNDVIFI